MSDYLAIIQHSTPTGEEICLFCDKEVACCAVVIQPPVKNVVRKMYVCCAKCSKDAIDETLLK